MPPLLTYYHLEQEGFGLAQKRRNLHRDDLQKVAVLAVRPLVLTLMLLSGPPLLAAL